MFRINSLQTIFIIITSLFTLFQPLTGFQKNNINFHSKGADFVSIQIDENSFEKRIKKGIDFIYNIEFDSAETVFKHVMLDYPEHPSGKFFLAMIDWMKIAIDPETDTLDDIFYEKLEDVIYFCDKLLEKEPKNIDAIFFKGGAIGFRGRLRALRNSWIKAADDGREALPLLQLAYSIDSTNYDILFGMGIYNYFAEVIPKEFPYIKPIMIFFPKGNKSLGIEQLKLATEKAKYASVESMYFLLQVYYQYEQNIYEARKYASILHEKYPSNPIFHRYLGRTFVRTGDLDSAAKVFQLVFDRSLLNYPGYSLNARREAAYYIALNYRYIGEYDSSIFYFNDCVEKSRKIDKKGDESGFQVSAALNLGMVYDLVRRREEAINTYNYVLSIKDWNNCHDAAKRYIEKPYGN